MRGISRALSRRIIFPAMVWARQALIHDAPERKLRSAVHARSLPGVTPSLLRQITTFVLEQAHRLRLPRREIGGPGDRVPIIHQDRIVNHRRETSAFRTCA